MFNAIGWFATGTVAGVWLAQNYNVPNVRALVDQARVYAEQLEETSRKGK